MRSPIGLKLGGDLGLVSQISVHALVSRLSRLFTFCKQKTRRNCENHRFRKLEFSPPFQVRLILNLVGPLSCGSPVCQVWDPQGSEPISEAAEDACLEVPQWLAS
jgi:hypothetical protein